MRVQSVLADSTLWPLSPISEGMRLSTVEGVASMCRHVAVVLFAQCWLWPGNENREKGTLQMINYSF